MKKVFLFVCVLGLTLILCQSSAEARKPLVIWGNVADMKGRPISGALVAVPALSESTETNDQGTYRITIRSTIKSGQKVVVVASREGFDYSRRSVTLSAGTLIKLHFRLATIR